MKEAAVDSNKLWKAAGKLRHGPIFDKRQSSRLEYRRRIRERQNTATESYTNDLHEALLQKTKQHFGSAGAQKLTASINGNVMKLRDPWTVGSL